MSISEAGIHYKQLMDALKKHSSYSEPSIVSHKHLCSEWIVIESNYNEEAGMKCICGKENIRYINKIMNHHNGLMLEPIGSSCIKRFEIEPMSIACMCCSKALPDDNSFLQAYMKYQPVTKNTLIIGHKKCAKKLLKNAFLKGRYGKYLKKEFVSYFNDLGVSMKLDKDANIDMEYSDHRLIPYMDALFD
jgi:hypothetical protein